MHPDTPEMNGGSPPKRGGARIRLKSLHHLDRRTAAAKQVFDLRDQLIADLGGKDYLSVMQMELINNVTLLGGMLKDCAAAYLQGEPLDLMEFQTLTNAQRRLISDLGLERRARDVTPDLRRYLHTQKGEPA